MRIRCGHPIARVRDEKGATLPNWKAAADSFEAGISSDRVEKASSLRRCCFTTRGVIQAIARAFIDCSIHTGTFLSAPHVAQSVGLQPKDKTTCTKSNATAYASGL